MRQVGGEDDLARGHGRPELLAREAEQLQAQGVVGLERRLHGDEGADHGSGDGVGTATVNVGSSGDAFGVANNATLTVMDLLLATNAQAVNGTLYNGDTARRNEANDVYSTLNDAGGIS